MSDHEDNGEEWDERHEKRKSWNPFARRGGRLSGALEKKDVTEGLRRQAKEEEEKGSRRESAAGKEDSGRSARERPKTDDLSKRKNSLASSGSGSRSSSMREGSSPAPASPATRSATVNERGSSVSFRAMREEKAEHERKEKEIEDLKKGKHNDSDDDGDRVNGELRAYRRSSVATTVDARRSKIEKDVDVLRAEKRRSERASSRHKLEKASAEDKIKAREEVEKKKRELERKKKEIEERIAKKKEEKEKREKSERGGSSDKPAAVDKISLPAAADKPDVRPLSERSERAERPSSSERSERSEKADREERDREREARVRERERKDKEERERKEREDREEKERKEREREKKEREEREREERELREREEKREREERERKERERREREERERKEREERERKEKEAREQKEREERERKEKEEAERREREERERKAKEAKEKEDQQKSDEELTPRRKTVANKRVPLERKESMVDSWAKKQMALLKEKKEKKEKEREDREGVRGDARDSTSESEGSSDEASVRRPEVVADDRRAAPVATSALALAGAPTVAVAAAAASLAAGSPLAARDKKKLERERKENEKKLEKEKKRLEKEMREKAKEEKKKEKEKEKAEKANKKNKDKKGSFLGLGATNTKTEGGDDQPVSPRQGDGQQTDQAQPSTGGAAAAAAAAAATKPPALGRTTRGKGPASRPSLLDSALATANPPAKGGGKVTRSAEEKSRMLGTQLIQMSVPNIKRKNPTFIPGFNPFPLGKGDLPTTSAAAASAAPANGKAAEGKKDGGKDAKGFARALLDFDKPKNNPNTLLTRQTGWGRDARGTLRDVPASKRGQLQSMKADRFWFSTINFAKARDEGVRKAKVDSLETQLSLKWDDFIESLPKIQRLGAKKVRDGYDAAGVEKLENQGAAIVSALKLTAGARPTELKAEPGKKEVALPSYLRDFTGDEDETDNKKKHEDTRAKKYAVDMFLTANPNIAKDASYDELFGECASEDPGLYIWRIEYFIPLEIDDEDYPDLKCKPPRPARLFSEDCYVILHITSLEKAKKFTIFTWIGAKSTVDKQGTAAYRSRELNIFLNSKAMITREIQYDESDDFMELFGWSLDYQDDGGTESAFKPTLPFSQEPRFYRLTFAPLPPETPRDAEADPDGALSRSKPGAGKRSRRYFSMRQVRLSALSLNSTDVFVLDGGTDGYIFQWNGSRSERALQFKGHEICTRINRYERSCASKIRVLEEGFEDADRKEEGPEWRNFWDYMREPLEGPVPERGPDVVDDILLCKTAVDPDTGRPRLAVIRKGGETGPLSKQMLDPSAAVIMDAFTELFVWIGHKSSLLQRQIARAAARRFRDEVNKEGRPSWTPINVIHEDFEPSAFIAKFPDWCAELFAPLPSNFATAQMTRHRIAPTEPVPKISIDQVVNLRRPPPEPFVDEGGGGVEVWAIEDGKPTFTKIPAEERGHFYSGDCYLVLYTFYNPNDNMKQAYLCYFWEGRSSSNRWWPAFLFGFYPVLEKKILNYGGRPPVKLRVAEHKEPPHFMKLFKGHVIIHRGHRKKKLNKAKGKELYHIRRTTEDHTHTVQVKAVVSSLNSKDAFALRTPTHLYLWYGKGTGFEDSTAILKVSDMIQGGRTLEVLDEGEEVPAFWNTLGGWAEYLCNQQFLHKYREKARLFCFSNQTGRFEVSEVYDFFQTDLNLANVYLLDTYHEVYVWLGKSASESQYKQVLEFANRYVREMATRRKIYVPLIATEDGEEPVEFTRHFHTWVTKPPFVDPAIGRDDRYADLMFQVYKRKEQEKAKEKELRLAQAKPKEPLRKVDWIEWIRKEIPELILSEEGDGDYSDEDGYGEGGEYDDEDDDDEDEEEEITFDQVGERGGNGDEENEEDNNGGDGNSDDSDSDNAEGAAEEYEDEEIVYGEVDAGDFEDKPKAVGKTAAEYLLEKVHKESKYFKMYHT